jgi:hypothetical protein
LANADKLPDYKAQLERIKTNIKLSRKQKTVGTSSSIVSKALSMIGINTKADITDYLILMGDKTRLLTPEEVAKVTAPGGDNPNFWVVLDDGEGLTNSPPPAPKHKAIGHFITPSQVIIDEYRKLENIKIFMATNPLVVTAESKS